MNLFRLVYILRFAESTDGAGGQTPEQIEAQLAAVKAELEAEKLKVKNQNSYITKLEADKKPVSPTTPDVKTTPTPPATAPTVQSAAEIYAINAATKEIIDSEVVKLKAKYGEEAVAVFEEEFRQIARANIKDPFKVPDNLMERAAQMSMGAVMSDETKRPKIMGAFVKAPATPPTPTPQAPQGPVVVNDPAAQQISTMQPGDGPALGPNNPVAPDATPTKPVSPSAFLQGLRTKK